MNNPGAGRHRLRGPRPVRKAGRARPAHRAGAHAPACARPAACASHRAHGEVVQADVHDARPALSACWPDCDAVVNLVAILHGSEAAFEHVHVALPRRWPAACQAAGVRAWCTSARWAWGPAHPRNYLRSKAAGEAVLQAAGLALTVLRPSVIFGADDRFLNLFAQLQALAPVAAGRGRRALPAGVGGGRGRGAGGRLAAASIGQVIECAGPAGLHACRSWCAWPAAGGPPRPQIRAAGWRWAAAGRADGMAARRAADVARQRRFDARAQRGQRQPAGPARALGITPAGAGRDAVAPPGYLGPRQGAAGWMARAGVRAGDGPMRTMRHRHH
jgi:uncharacterized protein YbjT (DUF2867 family)